MKKTAILLLSTSLMFASPVLAEDKVVASLDGQKITEAQIMTQFKDVFTQPQFKDKKFSELEPGMKNALIETYVNTTLIENEAKKSKIDQSADFKKKIASMKEQLMQQMFVESYLDKHITNKMIDDEYDKLKKDLTGKEEIKTSHILLKEEADAKAAKKKLNKGAKFADVVKEFSTDDSTKGNGGELGYFIKGQLVPEYEAKAFSMKKGDISEPVKSQFGWHIIRLDDKRPVKIPSKSEAKNGLKARLSQDALGKLVNDLRAKYNVKIEE